MSGCFALVVKASAVSLCAQEAVVVERESRVNRVKALQGQTWEVHGLRVDPGPDIDGRLDDVAWQRAEPVTEFYQRERNEGLPATERTEVRVVFDRALMGPTASGPSTAISTWTRTSAPASAEARS